MEDLETYASKNAEVHKTDKYELVKNSQRTVLRRSARFFLGVKTSNRVADFPKDNIRVVFLFGKYLKHNNCMNNPLRHKRLIKNLTNN